jgi:O-6-methylguanine DNA methyltransferase
MKGAKIFEKVYEVVSRIPRGKVTTYAVIASCVGTHPRVVAMALRRNPRPIEIPCHRVIRSDRSIGGYTPGGPEVKRALLKEEGIRFDRDGRVLEEFVIRNPRQLCGSWIDKRKALIST